MMINRYESLEILKISGKNIEPHIPAIASLRIRVFREFPYIYDGSMDYEKEYLSVYVNSPESIAILVYHGEELVGASTGLPLSDDADDFKKPFIDNNMDPENVFYCGESILLSEYRGRGIYPTFIHGREKHARNLGKFNTICFCAVQRPENHPLQPVSYRPLDAVWKKYGYNKHSKLITHFSWKDVDEKSESPKKLVFWLKKL